MTPARLAEALMNALDPLKLDVLSQFTVEDVTHVHCEKTPAGEQVFVIIGGDGFNITIKKARS